MHKNIIGNLYIAISCLWGTLWICSVNIFPIIINNNEIRFLNHFWKKDRYNVYSFNDVVSYKITRFSIKLQFKSNLTLNKNLGYIYKEDRELLKKLLAEKISVKPL